MDDPDLRASRPERQYGIPDRAGQLPPHAPDAERALLGTIMESDRDLLADLADELELEWFFDLRHRAILEHLIELNRAGRQTSLPLLCESLRAAGMIESTGGLPYLMELGQQAMSGQQARELAKTIRDKWRLRKFIQEASQAISSAQQDPGLDVDQFLTDSTAKIANAGESSEQDDQEEGASDLVSAYLEYCEGGKVPERFRTGLIDLDQDLKFRPGEVLVVGARPSVGKTSLGMTMVLNMAMAGIPVGIMSFEMARDPIRFRLISQVSDVPFRIVEDPQAVDRGEVNQRDVTRMHNALVALNGMPIRIWTRKGRNVQQVVNKMRVWQKRFGTRVVMIDYIQLISFDKKRGRYDGVTEISAEIHNAASDLNMAVILLSQINRNSGDQFDRPRMNDLKESGAIEQDADHIVLIHKSKDTPGRIHAHLDKQRNGPTGSMAFGFEGQTMRFRSDFSADEP